MSALDNLPILQEGVWLYAGTIPVRVRLVQNHETWGTGDYEDEEHIAENQPIPSVFALYEASGSPGKFCNVMVNLGTLNDAIKAVEDKFPGIRWDQSNTPLDGGL